MTATASDFTTFFRDLNATLQIECEGKKSEIYTGHILEVDIKLHSYGHRVFVAFTTFGEDETHAMFGEEKVMKASLTFKSTDPQKAGAVLLELRGIVEERSYSPMRMGDEKKIVRGYRVQFTDFARASWAHHFPIKIYVDQTMKDVIDAEKNPLISIKYDLPILNEVSPIIALPISSHVSFYSFLMWYLYKFNGIWDYNYKEHSYSISEKKSEGKTIVVPEWEITPAICKYPEPPRYIKRLLKHSAESSDHTDEDNPNGFQAVRKDEFDESSYTHFPEQVSIETESKLAPEKPALQFHLKDFSDSLTFEQLIPGTLIEIKGDETRGGNWCDESAYKGKIFRLTEISIKASNCSPSDAPKVPVSNFQLKIEAFAESKEESYVLRPPFQEPVYPFSIPGKIFCDLGDKEQTTFNIVKNEKIPLGYYLVKVPLVDNDKKIIVPFIPDFTSGHHYFPLCKDQQVMLSMYFQTAKIERILDWQPLARLPLDTQANQIVFASNSKDKFFIQKHEYKNGKDSVFIIQQSSSPEQTQTIQIEEKKVIVTVEEKGKHTTTIQLDRDSGLTLKLKDESSGVTQQSIYNSESMTHTSEGKGGKSTFVQKPDSISLECKKFNLKCDEATIEASKTGTLQAASKLFLKAPVINATEKVKMG